MMDNKLRKTATAVLLAAWEETNPYFPPQLVMNILTPSSAWQGRGRMKTSLKHITEILSPKRKQRLMPMKTIHQRFFPIRLHTNTIAVMITRGQDQA